MRALARQTSELDALDAHIANSVASAEDDVGEDGVATATVTPAKGVRTLTVKTACDDVDGEGDAQSFGKVLRRVARRRYGSDVGFHVRRGVGVLE